MLTRAEYQCEHLAEDIAYARTVPSIPRDVVVQQEGEVAWITSTFRVTGKFHDKPVDNIAAETILLTKNSGGLANTSDPLVQPQSRNLGRASRYLQAVVLPVIEEPYVLFINSLTTLHGDAL